MAPFAVECRLRTRDGAERWLHLRGRPRALADGATLWDAIALDVTERKQAEEAAALRSAAELANAAAHEINNPLTTIVGQLALIAEGADITGRIERMHAAALHIRDIVKHMERITRLEPLTDAPTDLPVRMLDIRRSSADDVTDNS